MRRILLLAALVAGPAHAATLMDNGPLSTGATTGSGVAAPAGATWSEVQHDAGSTTESNGTAGFSVNQGSFRLADDFTVPAGQVWTIQSLDLFAYKTGSAATPSPFSAITLQVWNGNPSDAGSTVVFGDTSTNRLSSSVDALMFRAFDTKVPAPGTAPTTTRRIWKNTVVFSPALVLPAGTYWVDWATTDTVAGSHFNPSVTVVGARTAPAWNGLQLNVASATWAPAIDSGNPTTAADVPQDFPFVLTGNAMGNGVVEAPETCDDGNLVDGDGCSSAGAVDAGYICVGAPSVCVQESDFSVTKMHAGDFSQGQKDAVYTLHVHNSGPFDSSGVVTLEDLLPAGLAATAMDGMGWDCDLGLLTCTRSDVLPAGMDFPDVTVTVDVALDAAPLLTNQARVTNAKDVLLGNNLALDATNVTQLPNLAITKAHAGDFRQGQQNVQYVLDVTNLGFAATAGEVVVMDVAPVGLVLVDLTGSGWTCDLMLASCTRVDVLDIGGAYPSITVTATVADNAPATLVNHATVSGGGETFMPDSAVDDAANVVQVAVLSITKTHTGDFRQAQQGATHTVEVANTGLATTEAAVTVVDVVPAGMVLKGLEGDGWACDVVTATCVRADLLDPGQAFPPITVTVDVDLTAAAQLINHATVEGGGVLHPGQVDDLVNVVQVPDVVVVGAHTGDFSQGQQGAQYVWTVTNQGAGPTTMPVIVQDTLPAGLTATALSGEGWTCDLPGLTCTRMDALAGGAAYPPVVLMVDVSTTAPDQVTNTVMVFASDEVVTTNNSHLDPTTIIQLPDATVAISDVTTLVQGQSSEPYMLTITNSGAGALAGRVDVGVVLSDGLTLASMAGDGWECVPATLTCSRMDGLAAGGAFPAIQVQVLVGVDAPAMGTVTAAVSLAAQELDTSNNSAVDSASVQQFPDLGLLKTHQGNLVQGQHGAQYQLQASNLGRVPTSGVVTVVEQLPAGLVLTAMSGTGWTCLVAQALCFREDVLAARSMFEPITVVVDVAQDAPAQLTNQATVRGGGNVNPANDVAVDPAVVAPASCGDGVVNAAERCDCGPQGCAQVDPCCDGATCQLLAGSQCSALDGCCSSSCQVEQDTSRVCAPGGGCVAVSTCDGIHASCQEAFVAPGTMCTAPGGGPGQCFEAACQSYSDACAAQGLIVGSCGTANNANPCGPLRCASVDNPRLCMDLGPTVPDGTPCDDGKQCLAGACVDSTTIQYDYCPDDAAKMLPGMCGCGTADTDSDLDGYADCVDACPEAANVHVAPCSTDGGVADDAGAVPDGGAENDAGALDNDAGTPLDNDAGTPLDAGVDAGTTVPVDAGARDAAVTGSDGGAVVMPDAAVAQVGSDAGEDTGGTSPNGCGCEASNQPEAPALLWAMGLLLLGVRRRARN